MDLQPRQVLAGDALDALIAALHARDRTVIGPVVRDGAIVLDVITSAADLPVGVTDEGAPGHYRLSPDPGSPRRFSWTVGPQSPKRWLHPPELTLFTARPSGRGFKLDPPADPPRKLAFLGLRACELAAIGVQDAVFLEGAVVDPHYAARRSDVLVIAVQCDRAASTCFCASMNTGPRVTAGYDLCLTEVVDEPIGHRFVVETGSPAGEELAAELPTRRSDDREFIAPERAAEAAEAQMDRAMPGEPLRFRLLDALQSDHWDDVAQRCLGCSNCTMVCPTCFCTTVHDVTDLEGAASRVRTWDSCFSEDFSYLHGHGPVRTTIGTRYRQWLTHKLATWHEQFGTSGCVGCGRCIAWCPAGIDIVAEARAASGLEES